MHAIDSIKRANQQTARDEADRLRASYEQQPSGEVWTRYEGVTKVLTPGQSADDFLASVKGQCPSVVRVIIGKRHAPQTVPA